MENNIKIALAFLIVILLFQCSASEIKAQNDARTEVVELYNSAQELAGNGEFNDAIPLYLRAFEISKRNNLDDITQLLEERIPKVYGSRSSKAYRIYQDKNNVESINTAITYFDETRDVAQEFGNSELYKLASDAMPQLYFLRATLNFDNDNYDESISDFERAIELYPNYAEAYLKKAAVFRKLYPNDPEQAINIYKTAIEKARMLGDSEIRNQAEIALAVINNEQELDNEGWEIVATFKGTGAENTSPFTINSNEWKIQYSSYQVGEGGHLFSLDLKKPGENYSEIIVNEANQSVISGETYYYETGRFYIDSNSFSGEWQAIVLIPKQD